MTEQAPPPPPPSGFLARFGTITPNHRPEDWTEVRAAVARAVGLRAMKRGR